MEQEDNKTILEKSFQNVKKFAEILYKCKLCTSLPSILTSEDCFLAHVNNTHLQESDLLKKCPSCPLKFRTKEDLWAHKKLMHSDFNSEDESSDDNEDNHSKKTMLITSEDANQDDVDGRKRKRGRKEKHRRKRKMKDVIQIKEEEDFEEDPHFVISHGAEGVSMSSPRNDSANLQKLTDQITSDANPVGLGGSNTSINYLSSTPEFGKYTKLVREGGNIVYFCQVCNWKTQMKIMFSEHCKSTAHLVKVTVAEQTDSVEKTSNAKGHFMSFLDEKINFYINKKLSGENLNSDTSCIDGKNLNQIEEEKPGQDINGDEDETLDITVKSEPVENNKASPPPTESRRSRRKRKFTNMIIQALAEQSDEDSDTASPSRKCQKTKIPTKVNETPQTQKQGWRSLLGDKLRKSASSFPPFVASKSAVDEESHNEARTKSHKDQVMYNDDVMNTHAKAFMLNEQINSSTNLTNLSTNLSTNLTEIIARTIDTELTQGATDQQLPQSSYFLYRCSLCPFGCNDISQYRVHFETEHEPEQTDVITDIGYTDCKTEHKKIQKIKELLPDVVMVHPRGNVSRDLLLQKASVMANEPEIALWGPACNRAVREMFPDSLAQRKGKYKKTYFFGIALIEQLQEQEAVSNDSAEVEFTALRDMTQDLDRILQHLPNIVKWKGDLEAGVSRDDVLHMLGRRIDEQDVMNWGLQCNRAIRILFPQVQMKRKGKYKATVYFGVTFSEQVTKEDFASLVEPKAKPPQKPIIKDDGIKPKLTWRDAIRTVDNRGLTARDVMRKSVVTRGWGPFNPPAYGPGILSDPSLISDGPPPNVRADMLPSSSSLPSLQENPVLRQALAQDMPLLRYHLTSAEMNLYKKFGADSMNPDWQNREQILKDKKHLNSVQPNIKQEVEVEEEKSNDADDENSQSANSEERGSPYFSNNVEHVETEDGVMYIKREIDSDQEK